MSGVLPDGWAELALSDVCSSVPQSGPSSEASSFRYIDLGAIDNSSKCVGTASVVPVSEAPSRARQRVAAGDVLFSTVRVYLENIALVPPELDGAVASTAFAALRPGAAIEPRFLYHVVTSKPFIQAVNLLQRGNSPPSVQEGDVRGQRIPLPPKAEQQRIVSRIEELFSEIDEGERALERVGQLVERYRQSVLKAAITGELTREWRAQHSTASVSASDDLPVGWRRVTVEELCPVQTGATPKRGEARYFDNGTIPWVTSGAVNASRITEATELITRAAIDETNAKVFPAGTLIVAMYGEGKTRGKISELGIAAATNQACAALLCADLEPEVKGYLRLFFEQHYDELRGQAAGGVQPNLNLSLIKQTVLPLPPQPEAREICNQVAIQLSQAEALRLELTRRRAAATALRQSILKAAFSGQLVPQDPRDEPASALLARLAAQAAEAPAAPRRRGRKPAQPAPA